MTSPDSPATTAGGDVLVTDRAVNRVVAAATASVPGTVEVGGGFDRITGMGFPRFDILVDRAGGLVTVEANIAVTWPAPVTDVAEKVRAAITRWVPAMTGYGVGHVNVTVGNVVDGRRVTREQVAAAAEEPQLIPVSVSESAVHSPGRRQVPAQLSTERHDAVHVAPERPLREVRTASGARTPAVLAAPVHKGGAGASITEMPLREVTVRPSPEPTTPAEPDQWHPVTVRVPEERPLRPVRTAPERPLAEVSVRSTADVVSPTLPAPAPLKKVRVNAAPNPVSAVLPVRPEPFSPGLPPKRPLTPVRVVPRSRFSPSNQKGGQYGRRVN